MKNQEFIHQPVLLEEVITGLAVVPNGIYIDATFGRGGHSLEILHRLEPTGRLLAIDKDPVAIQKGSTGPFCDSRFVIEHASFAELKACVARHDWLGKVNGILLDLGVSSPQLEDPNRGFSFIREGPLDMRMDPRQGISAKEWINTAACGEIARVLREYGEERFAKRIATAIVASRGQAPINTTTQLAEIIAGANPSHERSKHPATRSFQAIRIFINNELGDLRHCLEQCLEVMAIGARLCVISFHSLEDRIVKRFIQRGVEGQPLPPGLPIKEAEIHRVLQKVGGLIRPSAAEVDHNPRARSARLRIAEKIA